MGSLRRHCPGQGPSICTLLKVQQSHCTKALCIPLAFIRFTTSRVFEQLCVSQGGTLLELLIFGNVAVLSESKHATRFRGQPQTLFSALVSGWLLTDAPVLPEASHDRRHRTAGTEISAHLRPASGSVDRGLSNIILQHL